jgi:3'-phosphoadenosine 5'-phosphosulfate sulfotransferase (PAPS reductase)/FAD synthetase
VMALAFSGGKDSMACLHLMRERLDCAIYVDTGYAYPETQKLVEYAASMLPVHVVHSDRAGQNEREGIPADVVPIDWTKLGQAITGPRAVMVQSYLGCCYENVSAPLLQKAQELGVTELVYGQRTEEHHKAPSRNGDVIAGIKRLHPIEDWTTAEVLDYLKTKMEVPPHYAIKHSSLDCYDCTAYRKDSADRVQWMRLAHPEYFERYSGRALALEATLQEAG